MAPRLILALICMFSALFLPFWTTFILGLVGMFYFPLFIEAVLIFLLSDLLYGVEKEFFFNFPFVSASLGLISLGLVEVLKKKLKFYPNN